MIAGQEDTEQLEGLSLAEVLARDDLCLEEVLSIGGIHAKIRQEMRLFVNFCSRNDSFTDRLIALGLKCPMHQSASPQMKTLTFIAADILTSDHDAVVDLLLPNNHPQHTQSDDDAEIAEEIQTESAEGPSESERYKWLNRIMEYLQGEELEENCVNYIAKCLQVLVRKRLGALLEYLRYCPDVMSRVSQISHFPSIAQLLAKLVTDDDDHMPPAAHEARQMLVPLLLQKLHSDISLSSSLEVVDALDQILQASRYSDPDEARSELQRLSDVIVSSEEIVFHLSALLPAAKSSPAVLNAISYLTMLVLRMNQDDPQEGSQSIYRPTLLYQAQGLFAAFSKLAAGTSQLAEVEKLLAVRWMELLVGMARHSRFGEFYWGIARDERLQAVRVLVWGVARGQFTGVMLQLVCTLVELVLLQEERIAQKHPDPAIKISPSVLYGVLSDHRLHLQEMVQKLSQQTPRQRNRNENGVFLRKLLVILDNYFNNSEIHRHFPEVAAVVSLFPTFTPNARRQYAEETNIVNHPAGIRARAPIQFGFMRRNKECLDQLIDDDLESFPQQLPQQEQPKKKEPEIVFKLTQKIRTLKDRVKEKQSEKQTEEIKSLPLEIQTKHQQGKNAPPSSCKERPPVSSLLYFVRHLPIY